MVALLNDLFGIQSRGGCSCAGPYGHRLLGIDLDRSHEFEREINRGCEGIKPGWVRINFNYFIADATFRYLLDAVDFVAHHGARFLADYRFEPTSGLWRHRRRREAPMSLHDIRYDADGLHHEDHRRRLGAVPLQQFIDAAAEIVTAEGQRDIEPLAPPETSADFEHLRWFPYPAEATATAVGEAVATRRDGPGPTAGRVQL